MRFDEHPTVSVPSNKATGQPRPPVSRGELQALALICGADEAGIVAIAHQELDAQRDEVFRLLQG